MKEKEARKIMSEHLEPLEPAVVKRQEWKELMRNLLKHLFFLPENPGIAEESRAFGALGCCARNKDNLVFHAIRCPSINIC